jgi:hypothetical protein
VIKTAFLVKVAIFRQFLAKIFKGQKQGRRYVHISEFFSAQNAAIFLKMNQLMLYSPLFL